MSDRMEELTEEIASLGSCCLHDRAWAAEDVRSIVAWRNESTEGYGSSDQVILVKLTGDKGYGLLTSWSDTTGHGCQCHSSMRLAGSLSELLSHLTDDELLDLLRDRSDD